MAGQVSAQAPTQQYGYIRCYRAVMKDCGVAAAALYGILEDYAQLSARNKQDCAPSHEKLGELLGVHRNTVIGLLKKLKDAKWVEWDERSGGQNVYHLPARTLHKNSAPPAQELCNTPTNIVQPTCTEIVHELEERELEQQQDSPPLPTGETPQGATRSEKPSARGKRLPKPWPLTEDHRRYALEVGYLPDEVAVVHLDFCEQWWSEARAIGRKLDWDLAFKRWLRSDLWKYQRRRSGTHLGSNGHGDPAMAGWLVVVKAKEQARNGRSPDELPAAVFDALEAVGGWAHVDPGNDFHRRDFLQAYAAVTGAER